MTAVNDLVRCLDIKDLADRLMSLTLAVRVPAMEQKTEPVLPEPEPVSFAVVLQGLMAQEKKISVFKAVREVTNLGLKETRVLVEGAPATIKTNLPKEEAAVLKKKLEDAGARVAVVPVCEG